MSTPVTIRVRWLSINTKDQELALQLSSMTVAEELAMLLPSPVANKAALCHGCSPCRNHHTPCLDRLSSPPIFTCLIPLCFVMRRVHLDEQQRQHTRLDQDASQYGKTKESNVSTMASTRAYVEITPTSRWMVSQGVVSSGVISPTKSTNGYTTASLCDTMRA